MSFELNCLRNSLAAYIGFSLHDSADWDCSTIRDESSESLVAEQICAMTGLTTRFA
jgi:hypothetical protein